MSNFGFATKQIHAGKMHNAAGALCSPIYQTSTFQFNSVEQGGKRFAGKEEGYIYSRLGNPTVTELEQKLACLEHGEDCAACSAGMGAISSAMWSLLKAGDELVSSDTLYGCTYALFQHGLPNYGIKVTFKDFSKMDEIKSALTSKTAVVYLETPCNPTLKVLDIEAIAKMVHEFNKDIKVVVDNTFASPYLCNPLTLGANVVVHSGTKYINGHGDVVCGFVISNKQIIQRVKMFGIKDMTGSCMAPFDAFLINRGLKTLDIRMEKHCDNAQKIAEFLEAHPAVDKVYYPGLKSFAGYEIAKKQMKRFGGMMSFELKASKEKVGEAINKLKLVTIAVSLGDAETLIEHPATMTHSTYSAEELKKSGISEGLVRLSVGLENVEDIINDLKSVLDTLI